MNPSEFEICGLECLICFNIGKPSQQNHICVLFHLLLCIQHVSFHFGVSYNYTVMALSQVIWGVFRVGTQIAYKPDLDDVGCLIEEDCVQSRP